MRKFLVGLAVGVLVNAIFVVLLWPRGAERGLEQEPNDGRLDDQLYEMIALHDRIRSLENEHRRDIRMLDERIGEILERLDMLPPQM